MNELISVIVPTYNLEDYIERCLNSILNQTYQNIQIIVIDDGSMDHTPQITDRYAKEYPDKIKVIHIPNGGVTNARLVGISQATGEWIGFVDGDDEIESDMYERLIQNAKVHNADISHCGYKTVVEEMPKFYFYNTGKKVIQDNINGLYDLISGEFVEPGLWNKLYRRKLFADIIEKELIDCSLKINEDLLINFYLFYKANKSVYEDFCPYRYMVRSTSASRNGYNTHKIYDPIKVKKMILNNVPKELKELAEKKYLLTCISSYSTLIYTKSNKNELRKVKNLIRQKKHYWRCLDRNSKIKLYLMFYIPAVYKKMNILYEKYFQKKRYI